MLNLVFKVFDDRGEKALITNVSFLWEQEKGFLRLQTLSDHRWGCKIHRESSYQEIVDRVENAITDPQMNNLVDLTPFLHRVEG